MLPRLTVFSFKQPTWSAPKTLQYRRSVITAAQRDADLIKGVPAENRADVRRILELAERAGDSWEVVNTSFYSPAVIGDAMAILNRLADVVAVPWGGYSRSERCRIGLGREEAMHGFKEDPSQLESVAALSVTGNFLFDKPTHRDFLGACLGTGIERTVVGDILVQESSGAQILASPSMVEHLESALTQVRSVPVRCRAIPLSELKVREPRTEEMTTVEASLRLDAIASAGFRMSRGKMTDMIKAGDVRVNWKGGVKASESVAAGDMISCAGKGRVEVKAIGETKKGKFAVELVRYV